MEVLLWSIVLQGRIDHDDSRDQFIDNPSFPRQIPPMNEENDVDGVHTTHNDHNEGIWDNILKFL